MPVYEHYCHDCGGISDVCCKIDDRKQFVPCVHCGGSAERIMSMIAIQCDSENDVKWLSSARDQLQPEGEKPFQTRGEYKRYLKNKGLEPKR